MKKFKFAFLLIFALLGVQALALGTFTKTETGNCNSEDSDSATFFLTNSKINTDFGHLEALLLSVNSFSFLSKNRIDSQEFGTSTPILSETIFKNISSGIIESFSLVVSNILDFLHPYLFFY